MTQTEVQFASDMEYDNAKLPSSVTGDMPFDAIRPIISNRPIRRRAVDDSTPAEDEYDARLAEQSMRESTEMFSLDSIIDELGIRDELPRQP